MSLSKFYDIARETAGIIHERSWEKNGILHVLLYGSALHSSKPEDIDLLIIHNGEKLVPYFFYRKLLPDAPPAENNARMPAHNFLMRLGYLEGDCKENSVLAGVEALVSPRNVNDVYDFNALDVALLKDENGVIRDTDMLIDGWTAGILGSFNFGRVKDVRERAIRSCKETNFWYTILSEGRIYDPKSSDFSIKVPELFPDALRLFPSNPDARVRN